MNLITTGKLLLMGQNCLMRSGLRMFLPILQLKKLHQQLCCKIPISDIGTESRSRSHDIKKVLKSYFSFKEKRQKQKLERKSRSKIQNNKSEMFCCHANQHFWVPFFFLMWLEAYISEVKLQ